MRALQCLSLALLFLATAVPSKAQDAAAPPTSSPAPDVPVVPTTLNVLNLYTYTVGQKFALNCTQLASEPKEIYWAKNGTEVTAIPELKGRYELRDSVFQMTAKSDENDYGNYTCHKRDVSGTAGGWQVLAKTFAKLDPNTNVVEGQKLKLQCKLIGKPYPPVTWVRHEADGSNTTITPSERIKLVANEQNVTDATLVLEAAQRGDAGAYTCAPAGGVPDSTTLRVKDMYAALWPFLGICIEVFILCTIILVYEKRRTKPELDDSDTDNHDQKKS